MPSSVHVIGSKTLGGAERFYLRLIEAFHARGEPVVAMLRSGSEVAGQVPSGIPVIETPMKTVWDPFSRYAVSKAMAALKPDIVQTYMGRATRLTHLPRGRRAVHVARLCGSYKLSGYFHADAWIGCTKQMCDYMIEGGLPARRVHLIGNFIDPPEPPDPGLRLALRSESGIPQDALLIVSIGRFVPVKGHRHLLESFARLHESLHSRPLWLALVGDGPLRESLHRQARELGIAERVMFPGWQNEPGRYYRMADLVVFPSLEQEALGNVILETWAHSKPLLTTAFHGARELTRHGEDAWRVPCGDVHALAEGMRAVLFDESLAYRLAQAGHERVQREFSREAVVNRYFELYANLLR
jgi:glycosyltransferase involved in cell wall biosynthesis